MEWSDGETLQANNRNFIIAATIVICTGITTPLIKAGINLGILIQIIQYLAIWGFFTFLPAILFHYAPIRTDFQFKLFSIYSGFCFVPYLVRNIIEPLLETTLATHLDNVWDIEMIKQSTNNFLFQTTIFFYIAIPIIAFCLIIVFLGISMKKVYEISIEKAILIAIPFVFSAYFLSTIVGNYMLLLLI
ncbi:MAG: hypothetical protein ACTSYB_07465 [Candidatus Helarchaeota archaeon]